MVYCIGIPVDITEDEIASEEYFGLYGEIKKVVIMGHKEYQNSTSAYITYEQEI